MTAEVKERAFMGLIKGGSIGSVMALAIWILWSAYTTQISEKDAYQKSLNEELTKRVEKLETSVEEYQAKLEDCKTQKESETQLSIARIERDIHQLRRSD